MKPLLNVAAIIAAIAITVPVWAAPWPSTSYHIAAGPAEGGTSASGGPTADAPATPPPAHTPPANSAGVSPDDTPTAKPLPRGAHPAILGPVQHPTTAAKQPHRAVVKHHQPNMTTKLNRDELQRIQNEGLSH